MTPLQKNYQPADPWGKICQNAFGKLANKKHIYTAQNIIK